MEPSLLVPEEGLSATAQPAAGRGVVCPFQKHHRSCETIKYRICTGGPHSCNFCRRRVVEWVCTFLRTYRYHPVYDPDAFYTWATDTLKLPELHRFRVLYNGLCLGIRETFTVEFSRDRLGFFQPHTEWAEHIMKGPVQQQRATQTAIQQLFLQLTPEVQSETLKMLRPASEVSSNTTTAAWLSVAQQQLLEANARVQQLEAELAATRQQLLNVQTEYRGQWMGWHQWRQQHQQWHDKFVRWAAQQPVADVPSQQAESPPLLPSEFHHFLPTQLLASADTPAHIEDLVQGLLASATSADTTFAMFDAPSN